MANYGAGVGKWGVGFLVGICAVGAVACSSGSPTAREGPHIGGVRFPTAATVDPGVMKVGPAPSSGTRHGLLSATPDGMRVTLDECDLRAPGDWFFAGHVALPHGKHDVTATLDLGFANGDVGRSTWAHVVTFTRSGRFEVAVPGPAAPEGDARRPTDDGVSGCNAFILAASVPVARDGGFVAPTAAHVPFVYRAPVGSIQGFGIGAPLDQPNDPRTISLYTVWSGARSAVPNVAVPVVAGERPALVGMGSATDPCSTVSIAIGPDDDSAHQITVTTGFDCGAPRDDPETLLETHEPVAGAHGFTWAHPRSHGDPDVARRTNGTEEIWVQGGAAVARTTVAHIAATLTAAVNVATQPPAGRPALLNNAVTDYLRDHPGWNERARFHYRGGWAIVIESAGRASWNYRILSAGHAFSGWWSDSLGGGGGQSRCFDGPSSSMGNEGQDRYAFSIAGYANWTIQGLVDGKWVTVPTTHGVEFVDATAPHPVAVPLRERPVDATGHVPPCFG